MWVAITEIITAILTILILYLRKRISQNWIDYRHSGPTNLHGKTIILTGSNVGLGYEAAKDLARRNATVILACRDVTKGREAADKIISKTNNENVTCMQLDLASLKSVKTFASEVTKRFDSIYALVCNAGVCIPMKEEEEQRQTTTKEGFEIHFGVNHLGHFALVTSLLDHLKKQSKEGEECRIVWVTSGLMKGGKIDMKSQDFVYKGRVKDKSEKGFMPTGYMDSKLMNSLTCRHLSTLLPPSTNVRTYAVCPGFCRSGLGRYMKMSLPKKIMAVPVMRLIQRTTVQGAQNILFVTLEDGEKLKSGSVYRDGEYKVEENGQLDKLGNGLAKELWSLSEKLLVEKKYSAL